MPKLLVTRRAPAAPKAELGMEGGPPGRHRDLVTARGALPSTAASQGVGRRMSAPGTGEALWPAARGSGSPRTPAEGSSGTAAWAPANPTHCGVLKQPDKHEVPSCHCSIPSAVFRVIIGQDMIIPKVSRRYGVNCNTSLHEAPTAGPCPQTELEATRQRATCRRRECSAVTEGARSLSGAPSGSRGPALDLCRLGGARRAKCLGRQHQPARMCPRRGYSCIVHSGYFNVKWRTDSSRTQWNSISSFATSPTEWREPTHIVPRRRAAAPDASTSLASARLARTRRSI